MAQCYHQALGSVPELVLPVVPSFGKPTYQSFMVRVKGISADQRMEMLTALKERGIGATPGVTAIHRQTCYVERMGRISLPNTELATDTTVILPLFPDMTSAEQDQVIRAVKDCLVPAQARRAA